MPEENVKLGITGFDRVLIFTIIRTVNLTALLLF